MSAVLAILSSRGAPASDPMVGRMLARMQERGGVAGTPWRDDAAVLASATHPWEAEHAGPGAGGMATEGALVVVADATLYYRADLERKLRAAGVQPAGGGAAQLIAAAYRAWGERCVEHLEGDYAFALWDAERRRLLAGRDFGGARSLNYATYGDVTVVATTVGAILEHPSATAELNLAVIAETAAGLFGASHDAVYHGVCRLPAGHVLEARPGAAPVVRRFWEPPVFASEGRPAVPFERAQEELRALLFDAVRERMTPDGVTAASLSGGYDSPALFGVGQQLLRERGRSAGELRAVSISFPEGDLGREDDLIQAVARHWGIEPTWIDIGQVPMFDRAEERAAERDEPFAHGFETFNRALARGARDVGARVLLNGIGGDQLFHVEPVYLADLLRRGRIDRVAREWRATGVGSYRELAKWAVLPLMGARARALVARARGGEAPREYLDPFLPPWIRPDFAARHSLLERERAHVPSRDGLDAGSYERKWIIAHPFFPRVYAELHGLSVSEGVEQRAPLFDGRVLAFAATRPREERRALNETKRLLRASVQGLVPAEVLAPRRYRTGTTVDYFDRSMRTVLWQLAPKVFQAPLLAEVGVVDTPQLQRTVNDFLRGGADALATGLMFTLLTELWLRGKTVSAGEQTAAEPVESVGAA